MQCQRSEVLAYCCILSACTRFVASSLGFVCIFVEPVQVLEHLVLKTCTGSTKCKQFQGLYLLLKTGRQIAEHFHGSLALQNFQLLTS